MEFAHNIDIMQSRFAKKNWGIDKPEHFCLHRAVERLSLLMIVVLCAGANSCTTLVNRRDLYSPEPAPDSLEAMRQMTTVTTTTTRTWREEVVPAGY